MRNSLYILLPVLALFMGSCNLKKDTTPTPSTASNISTWTLTGSYISPTPVVFNSTGYTGDGITWVTSPVYIPNTSTKTGNVYDGRLSSGNTNSNNSSCTITFDLPANPSTGTYYTYNQLSASNSYNGGADSLFIFIDYHQGSSYIPFSPVAKQAVSVTGGADPSFTITNLKVADLLGDTVVFSGTF
jgi:hypothetical protein